MASLHSAFNSARFRVIMVISVLLFIGLATAGDYGVSMDERDDMLSVSWNLNLIRQGEPIPYLVEHYGTIFPFAAEAVIQAKSLLAKGETSTRYLNSGGSVDDPLIRQELQERIEIKHPFTFLFSLIAYGAAAGMVGILAGKAYAWLGPVMLALLPGFWGHSFFNARDIPFAAMFMAGSLFGTMLVGRYLQTAPESVRVGNNRLTAYTLLFGVLVGLVSGTRLAGCFLLLFVGLAHLALSLLRGVSLKHFLRFWSLYGLLFVAWAATVTGIHPAAWSNPVGWFITAMNFLSRYEWSGSNLFNGRYVPGMHPPWYYLPTWLAITTPLVITVLFLGGVLALLARYRKLSPRQQACALILGMQIGFLPAVAILRDSTIYDGARQFLFILPAVATVAAMALAWLYKTLPQRGFRLGLVVLFLLAATPVVIDMVALHPYEYVYFNRAFGGLQHAQGRFDTDYWGLSMREATEWINQRGATDTRVVSTSMLHQSETFALPDIDVVSSGQYDLQGLPRPFYYVARPRYALQEKFPECPVVYAVIRQEVPLTIVKMCE